MIPSPPHQLSINSRRAANQATTARLVQCAESALLGVIAAQPNSAAVCAEACGGLGQLASVTSLRDLLSHPQPQLVTAPLHALTLHAGQHEVAAAVCWALRGLCTARDGRSADRLALLLQGGGREALMRAQKLHTRVCPPLRIFCTELLSALERET